MDDKERLYFDALNEIAEHLGDSLENPISLSLLCLRYEISIREKEKIYVLFNRILRTYDFDDLDIKYFREAMIEVVPRAAEFADKVVIAFIKAYARRHIPELYPFSKTLFT
ncbi:MAG: hypothetical protein K2N51_14570 [Lachnospiraceae bacterium]|nr:hypothetical protein [Lachnospiraceae bacterium]